MTNRETIAICRIRLPLSHRLGRQSGYTRERELEKGGRKEKRKKKKKEYTKTDLAPVPIQITILQSTKFR